MVFPATITVDGVEYPILTSYRVALEWFKFTDNPLFDPMEKICGTLCMFFKESPPNLLEAYKAVQKFLLCGQKPSEEENPKAYDFEQDYNAIWAGFKSQHRIDLNEDKTMHWWEFKALFDELTENTLIKKIIQIRTMEVPSMGKDPKHHFEVVRMKEQFKLTDTIDG